MSKFSKLKKISFSPRIFFTSFIPVALVGAFAIIAFSKITNTIIEGNIKMMSGGFLSYATSRSMSILSDDIAKLSLISEVAIDSEKNRDTKETIDKIQKSASNQNQNILAYYYVTSAPLDKNGFLVSSDGWKAPSDFNQYEKSWYKNAVSANGATVFSSYFNNRANKNCIAVSKAVYSKDGNLLGVSGFDLDLEALSSILSSFKTTGDSKISVIDKNGIYLVSTDNVNVGKDNYFEKSEIGENGKAPEDFFARPKTILKGDRYFSVMKIGETPWFVTIEGSTQFFKNYLNKNLKIVIALVALISILATIYILWYLERTRSKEKKLGEQLFDETQTLVVATKETAATSQDQSAAVKEIVATMEDSTTLSENISAKIKDVSSIANKTSDDVLSGVDSLSKNVAKLREIFDANQQTISGIKALGDKIENIWDIVTLINSVADQAKIIAFNAELEASSAGEAGKNFHIVATEIRRLADGIIDGTKEIKEKINEIQQSSDSLILMSESGTEKINEGCENAKQLEEKFDSIKTSAEITATSSDEITSIIQQQAIASEQILITLKQIAAGVENFGQATENISLSAENLRVIAQKLNEQDSDEKNK